MNSKSKIWRLQFGLGTLLIFVTATAVLLRRPAARSTHQREVLRFVQPLDASVAYEQAPSDVPTAIQNTIGRDCFCDMTEVSLNPRYRGEPLPAPTDELLRHLNGLSQLHTLKVGFLSRGGLFGSSTLPDETRFTDVGMAHLGRLTHLQTLHVSSSRGTNSGLAHLANLTSLKTLYLGMPQATDDGLASLSRLHQLESLYLCLPKMSDDGLVHLRSLQKLKRLQIYGSGFTDAALDHLSRLSSLQVYRLRPNKFSREGRDRLRASLPTVRPATSAMDIW